MASSESTKSYISKYSDIKSKILGKTGYNVSICGFGCYRIDDGISQHQKALQKALLSGINIIDTSSNYSDGGSEILVGKVLRKLFSDNQSWHSILAVSLLPSPHRSFSTPINRMIDLHGSGPGQLPGNSLKLTC